jgi:hypothetical protein
MASDHDLIDEEDGDAEALVHWYAARPVTVSTAAATGAVIGAFAVGVIAALAAVALAQQLDD